MRLCILFMAVMVCSATAETLNQWLAGQVHRDEQMLVDALAQTGGHSLGLLKDSRIYVPFFLEAPNGAAFASPEQKEGFNALIREGGADFLAGGYVYKLKFQTAPPLYAVSAGEWSGKTWHSITLGKDLQIEPGNAWEGSNSDCLYATLLAGVRPRLIRYNHSGEVARQETFDASALDFKQRLQTSIAAYASGGKPILEMISLAEYLKQPDAEWRAADTTGQFNLRNQHQRPDEQERLKLTGQLARGAAISSLMAGNTVETQNPSTPKPPRLVQPSTSKKKPEANATPASPSDESSSSTPWSIIVVLILAALGLVWLLLNRRS